MLISVLMDPIIDSATVSAFAGKNPDANYAFSQVTLSDAETASAISTICNLLSQLPNLPALTAIERKRLSRLGIKSRGFVDLAIEAAKKDVGVLPRAVELQTLLDQDQLMKNLSLIRTHITDIKAKADSSLVIIGCWLYGVSRSIYAVMKTPVACTLMPEQQKELQKRFARPKKKKTKAEIVA